MNKNWRGLLPVYILTCLIILFPMILGTVNWQKIPDKIAVHYSLSGSANGFSCKAMVVYGIPAFFLIGQLVMILCYLFADKISDKANIPLIVEILSYWLFPVCSILVELGLYINFINIKAGVILIVLFLVLAVISSVIVYKMIKSKKRK